MHCLPKSIIQIITRSKGENELLIAKEVTPDFRILLVGGKGAGKTTFLKQAKLKYGKGFSESDRLEYRRVMINNLYQQAAEMFSAIKYAKKEDAFEFDEKTVQEIVSESQAEAWEEIMPAKHLEIIKRIWKEPKVKEMYQNYSTNDGGEYFLNQASRIGHPSYKPTIQEMMSIETPTKLTNSQIVNINGINFEVTDTPGCEENEISNVITNSYDFVIYFVSLKEFRTVKTTVELQIISENILNVKRLADSIGKETTILLYFTQTHEYIMTQKYANKATNIDYLALSKKRILRYFAKIIDSLPNKVYNFFEETNKLNNMKLVYELMKHEAIVKNLKNINLST